MSTSNVHTSQEDPAVTESDGERNNEYEHVVDDSDERDNDEESESDRIKRGNSTDQ